MRSQKTWLTIHFTEGDVEVEATLNYATKSFNLSHGSNDMNVTFNSEEDSMNNCLARAKCVTAALNYIKQELKL